MAFIKKQFLFGLFVICTLFIVGCSNQAKKVEPVADGEFEIYLFRHGKTLFNTTDQVQGWSDTPLTKAGVAGAIQVAKAFKNVPFDFAYSSDLGRARSTAKIILDYNLNKKPSLIEMEGLREVFYGSYEGKTNFEIMLPLFEKKGIHVTAENWADKYDELVAVSSEEWMINQYHENDPTHSAETYQQVLSRTEQAMDQIANEVLKQGGGRVLIVTHGEQIGMVIAHLFPDYHNTVAVKNCSLTIIKYKNGKYTLEVVGDTSYLKK